MFSLLASRIGALATDFTDTESSSLSSELRSSVGVGGPIGKAEVGSQLGATQTTGTQVLRKSTVQSTFRELYSYVYDFLVLAPAAARDAPPCRGIDDVLREVNSASGWAADGAQMKRGNLFEVEVELEADESFQVSTIMATLLELLDAMPQIPATLDLQGVVNAIAGTRLLNSLLAGLVPVRGRVLDYSHVLVDDHELVVHRQLLEQLPEPHPETRPLYVVGVAEERLFWRDIRRVLFSGGRYRMLCRLSRSGLQPDWTPVKLLDVLGRSVPSLRVAVDEIPSLLRRMSSHDQVGDAQAQVQRAALEAYAVELTSVYGHPLTTADLAERGLPSAQQCEAYATIESRREAFAALTESLAAEFGFAPGPELLAALRGAAFVEAQSAAGGVGSETADAGMEQAPGKNLPLYLDAEIVAAYW